MRLFHILFLVFYFNVANSCSKEPKSLENTSDEQISQLKAYTMATKRNAPVGGSDQTSEAIGGKTFSHFLLVSNFGLDFNKTKTQFSPWPRGAAIWFKIYY